MLFQFGDQLFEGRIAPTSFSEEDGAVWAEHQLLAGKNTLQPVGQKLQTITMEVVLRADFYATSTASGSSVKQVNVQEIINTLMLQMQNFREGKIIWGDGRVSDNYYIIENISKAYNQMFSDGVLVKATLNIALKELYIKDPLKKIEQTNRQNAKAVGAKKTNGPSGKKNTDTCSRMLSDKMKTIRTNVNILYQNRKPPLIVPKFYILINNGIPEIKSMAGLISQATSTSTSCVYNNLNIRTACVNIINDCDSIGAEITISYNAIQSQIETLKMHSDALESLLKTHIIKTITGNG